MRILVWNFHCPKGDRLTRIAELIEQLSADMLLAQEAVEESIGLDAHIGGTSLFTPAFRRRRGGHEGNLVWTRQRLAPVADRALGGWPWPRVAQLVTVRSALFANVHLSHLPCLRRRELARLTKAPPKPSHIVGDFNAFGAVHQAGYQDVTPKSPTFRRGFVTGRLDRVLVRNGAPIPRIDVIPTPGLSDHAALLLTLHPASDPPAPLPRQLGEEDSGDEP